MEVMLEIYQTLKALGMQWKEKGGQWGLNVGEDRQEMEDDEQNFSKETLDIYFVETRCRVREVVVRMDLQLYQVDAANYLVDFRNKGYYKADLDTEQQFNRIVGHRRQRRDSDAESGMSGASEMSKDLDRGIVDVSSPFLFLECACKLIVELAGG